MTQQNNRRDERSLQRWKADIERRIRSLETSPRAGNTSVSHGKFVIQDGAGGAHLLRAGYLGQLDGADVRGTAIHRPTGETAFATWQGETGAEGGFWAWYDQAGNDVFSDDALAGQGLATPYLGSALFAPGDRSKWPTVTSSSYTVQWIGQWYKQHPRLMVSVWTQTDSGTSGDVRVTCNGVSASQAVGSADNGVHDLIVAVPGTHLSNFQVVIELRRTSGTGFMGCWPMACWGVQS
jgi:hypothetical protein